MDELDELEQQHRKLLDEANKLAEKRSALSAKRQRDVYVALRPLAQRAHDLFCGWNHYDGCSWGYEEDRNDPDASWCGSAHKNWLARVSKLVHGKADPSCRREDSSPWRATPDQILVWLNAMESVKSQIGPQAFGALRMELK